MSTRCPNPECRSDKVVTLSERYKIQQCKNCHHEWPLTEFASDSTVSLSEAADAGVRAFCRALANSAQWVETVENDWPAPIAHEYHQLRQLLLEGQIIGAIWQLKDVAEVLIKFPAIAMAQTVLRGWGTIQRDQASQDKIRQQLLIKPLSMGDWHRLAGDMLAPLFLNEKPVSAIARLFRSEKGKTTELHELLGNLNEWRNEQIGHGALRLEVKEFQEDLGKYVAELNQCLRAVADVWEGMRLKTATGEELHGWQLIRERHEKQAPGERKHRDEEVALALEWNTQKLSLAPLAMLKRCTVSLCQRQDVFFFDSRKGQKDRHEIYFLDYLAGHKMSRPGHLEPELAVALKSVTSPPEEASLKQDYLRADLDKISKQLKQTLASQGQAWPPQWQNDLAMAYMNRGVALASQGDLAGAVGDLGVAIALREQLLFEQRFVPVLPDLAIAYYNLVLLSQRQDLPATLSATKLQQGARTFLQRLEALVDIKRLLAQWRRKIEDLREKLAG